VPRSAGAQKVCARVAWQAAACGRSTRALDVMRTLTAIGLLAVAPISAFALESDEFHLYGQTSAGSFLDITPFGDNVGTEGDPDSDAGISGTFFLWKEAGTNDMKAVPIGRCQVRNAATYTFSCASGTGLFQGVAYVGEKIDDRTVMRNPDAKKLYRAWLAKMDHGAAAAYYRCKEGCTDKIPKSLIFVWYGD
jgi:hypothetical protein